VSWYVRIVKADTAVYGMERHGVHSEWLYPGTGRNGLDYSLESRLGSVWMMKVWVSGVRVLFLTKVTK